MSNKNFIYIIIVCAVMVFLITGIAHSSSVTNNRLEDYCFYDTTAVDTAACDTAEVDTSSYDYVEDNVFYGIGGNIPKYDPDYDDDYAVTSVAGADFGDSRDLVMSKLKSRFGYDYTNNGASVSFFEPTLGGYDYTYGEFYFMKDKFVAAQFVRIFPLNEFVKAKKFRDSVAGQYGLKYKNIKSRIDKKGFKYYICGQVVNNRYPIMISLRKSESKGGKWYYYVYTDYFEIINSLNDEI